MIKTVLKMVLAISCTYTLTNAADIFKGEGVTISYEDPTTYDQKTIAIKRIFDDECRKVNGGDPDVIFGGNYAKDNVPAACKKTFVTTAGILNPIKIDGIETYGELEVIDFIQKAQDDDTMLLVDARLPGWYKKGTIPTAVNLSFKSFEPKHQDFEIVLDTAGVIYEDKKYDFSDAKTLVLFCNGIWCPQSTWAIENLIKIGYPKDKLKWYRGGIYAWKNVNLTTINP